MTTHDEIVGSDKSINIELDTMIVDKNILVLIVSIIKIILRIFTINYV